MKSRTFQYFQFPILLLKTLNIALGKIVSFFGSDYLELNPVPFLRQHLQSRNINVIVDQNDRLLSR